MAPSSRSGHAWRVRRACPSDASALQVLLDRSCVASARWSHVEIARDHVQAWMAVIDGEPRLERRGRVHHAQPRLGPSVQGNVIEPILPMPDQVRPKLAQRQSEEVLGVMVAWLVARELQIMDIAVHPTSRRLGIAKSLMLEAFQQTCGGWDQVVLEVRKSNIPAIKLYECMGFKVVGERPKYYKDGETALIMVKLSP